MGLSLLPDARDDALSLTLPKLGSRTRARRRKIPKPPWWKLFWVIWCVLVGAFDAATGHWVSFGYMMFLLGGFWAEMLYAMRLRRVPWWMRGPGEGLMYAGIVLVLLLITIIFG